MKIIEGQFAGKQILYKEQKGTRVTTDKVRKAVFDVLKNLIYIEGAKVADLFCGSGMYGIEAVSRGADSAWFVDEDRKVTENLKKNLKEIESKAEKEIKHKILNFSYNRFINTVGAEHVLPDKRAQYIAPLQNTKFDLVFADPPYYQFDFEKLNTVHQILDKGGIFVLEQSKRVGVKELNGLELFLEKKYGDTKVLFYKNKT